jgi:hypothetical protein
VAFGATVAIMLALALDGSDRHHARPAADPGAGYGVRPGSQSVPQVGLVNPISPANRYGGRPGSNSEPLSGLVNPISPANRYGGRPGSETHRPASP